MRKVFLFMHMSLDGYVETPEHDISWAHDDGEIYSDQESQDVDAALFGHRTYDMMKSYWPTPQAEKDQPEIARFMNDRQKYVASHQSFDPGWKNVTVLSGDAAATVRKLKEGPGKTIGIFGSNNLCASLVQQGLIDEIQIVVNPVVLGKGTALFAGLQEKVDLRLVSTRQFKSGKIMLTYAPAGDRE